MINDKAHASSKNKESTEKFLLTSKCIEFLRDQSFKARSTLVIQVLRDPRVEQDMKEAMMKAFILLAKNEGIRDTNKLLGSLQNGLSSSGDTLAKVLAALSLISSTATTLTMGAVSKVTHDLFLKWNPRSSHTPIYGEIDRIDKRIRDLEDLIYAENERDPE